MLVKSQKKYGKIVQMGNQQRSSEHTIRIIKNIQEGLIGKPYFGKAWYSNQRKSIGIGKVVPVPGNLDWDLWQGPAPRRPYKDNIHPYNWHWFWHWGTGEALNNGTHEVDVARWGLNVDFPTRVTSVGGRYHFKDDWQTPDTQIITWDYPGRVSLMWENRSCNGRNIEGLDRGIIFYGENGSLDTGRDEYKVYDLAGKLVKEVGGKTEGTVQGRDAANPSPGMDGQHIADFLDAIRNNRRPNCDVEHGFKSTVAAQLGNIAWRMGRDLKIDPKNGHIIGDTEAQKLWSRDYEKGWEPKV
jgi:predicted dehydrogenase